MPGLRYANGSADIEHQVASLMSERQQAFDAGDHARLGGGRIVTDAVGKGLEISKGQLPPPFPGYVQ